MTQTIYRQKLYMSSKSLKNVGEIIDELCAYYGASNPTSLAGKLGYKSNDTVHKWIERDRIPVESLSKKRPELNPKFLLGYDAPIEQPGHKIEENIESEEGIRILKRIQKEFVAGNSEEVDSRSRMILLAFRDQLQSQKSETDSMIQLLNILLDE